MDRDDRIKRLRFRAWHRGTREADYMIGGYFDRLHVGWDDIALDWFEGLLNKEDVDIMGWAIGTISVPPEWQGAMMERMQRIDYINIPK